MEWNGKRCGWQGLGRADLTEGREAERSEKSKRFGAQLFYGSHRESSDGMGYGCAGMLECRV